MAETKKTTTKAKPAAKATANKAKSASAAKKPSKPAAVKVQKTAKVAKPSVEVQLPKNLFNSEKIYEQAIFDTIMSERASVRQGTHQVKNRAEVSGSGKKP